MTPRVPMVDLPRGIAHCRPATEGCCPQCSTCARAERRRCDAFWVIDASVTMRAKVCPMFIDKRGDALLTTQQRRPS